MSAGNCRRRGLGKPKSGRPVALAKSGEHVCIYMLKELIARAPVRAHCRQLAGSAPLLRHSPAPPRARPPAPAFLAPEEHVGARGETGASLLQICPAPAAARSAGAADWATPAL
jgi:hypothetical protein